ncbi:UNKNOWN [Stylonychia lemnae]|uniref:Uncharacterized protein n=1 Tax=Stylonychia lemnae TaxID=5949 RepID=A0A078AGN1_STYLE|nr:UNKNOWN [Stylonychia lemnae]|eukprot:CDW81440.1 UNKNOWN [Stylonychia lemnae]
MQNRVGKRNSQNLLQMANSFILIPQTVKCQVSAIEKLQLKKDLCGKKVLGMIHTVTLRRTVEEYKCQHYFNQYKFEISFQTYPIHQDPEY